MDLIAVVLLLFYVVGFSHNFKFLNFGDSWRRTFYGLLCPNKTCQHTDFGDSWRKAFYGLLCPNKTCRHTDFSNMKFIMKRVDNEKYIFSNFEKQLGVLKRPQAPW